jgi:predicted ArsR family transcriptional regulator
MDLPTDPDDMLAQPTRARLFGLLAEVKRPASAEELAEQLGLHPNGVRVHLGRLHEAGLVVRGRLSQQRGRPRHGWSIAPDAQPGGDPPHAYEDLGRWLARAIPPSKARLRDVERAGREIGRKLAPRGGGSAREAMQSTLTALGFQPRLELREGGGACYCLANCPYRDAVRENQQLICTLHRGLTRGLLDELAPKARLAGFVARDPYEAGCLIEIEGLSPDQLAARSHTGAST